MSAFSLRRLAAAVGGLAVALTAATGLAVADPVIDPVSNPDADVVINSTCTYPQVMAALTALDPAAAAQLNAVPPAQGWVQSFVAAPPAQRPAMIDQVRGVPEAQPYLGLAVEIAKTCNNY